MANVSGSATGTTGAVWRIWADSGTSATTDCITADSGVDWTTWTSETSVSACSSGVWYAWADNAGVVQNKHVRMSAQPYVQRQLTAEEIEAQRVQQEQYAEQRRIQQAQWALESRLRELAKEAAEVKAKELLQAFLSDEQRKSLDEMSAILVKSERDKLYRVYKDEFKRVEELDADGEVVAWHCIHPAGTIPEHDSILAKKMMLEVSEDAFRRIAIRTDSVLH